MFITKFDIITCEKPETSNTYVVGFAPVEDPEIALYFPIPEEDAFLLKFMLQPDKDPKNETPNMKLLGLYKAMLDGFESSGTFLSGVVFGFEKIENEEILSCKLCLSKVEGGLLENMMNTTFSIAVILAIMSDIEVFMTDDLISKLLPALENESENLNQSNENTKKEVNKKLPIDMPVDKNIEKIAKQIMSGQVKKNTKTSKTPKSSKNTKSKKGQSSQSNQSNQSNQSGEVSSN